MSRIYKIPTAFSSRFIDREYDNTAVLASLNNALLAAANSEPADGSGAMCHWVARVLVGQRAVMTKAEVLVELTANPIAAGDHNPFYQFISDMDKSGNTISRTSSWTTMKTVNDDDLRWTTAGRAFLVYSVGGDIEDLLIVAQISDVDAEVPAGLPGRTYPEVDENGDPTGNDLVHTWTTWKSSSSTFLTGKANGNTYLSLLYQEEYLKASEWVPLYLNGLTILTKKEYDELPNLEV